MRLRQILNIGLFLLLFSCKTKNNSSFTTTNKDTVIEGFLKYTSQIQSYDTANYNYKIIKAHFNNDSVFLKQVIADIERSKQQKNNSFPDSIRRHPNISKMEIDEVYQFNYTETFCNFSFYFTISKKEDSIKLNSVIYQENREPSFLRLFKESEIKLSLANWEDFKHLIDYADFWGLNQYKEFGCCDGDFLSVEAIERNRFDHRIVKQHRVDRQFVSNTAMYSAYTLLAKFANYKRGCDFK